MKTCSLTTELDLRRQISINYSVILKQHKMIEDLKGEFAGKDREIEKMKVRIFMLEYDLYVRKWDENKLRCEIVDLNDALDRR